MKGNEARHAGVSDIKTKRVCVVLGCYWHQDHRSLALLRTQVFFIALYNGRASACEGNNKISNQPGSASEASRSCVEGFLCKSSYIRVPKVRPTSGTLTSVVANNSIFEGFRLEKR